MEKAIYFNAGITIAILIQYFFNDGRQLATKAMAIGLILMWMPMLIIVTLSKSSE